MSVYKIPLNQNVLEAAQDRIASTLEALPRICVSFSGGKDSGLMLHLTAAIARQLQKKINVLFIDWEAQFSCTIDYIQGAARELFRCHRKFLLGGITADDAEFTVTISTRMAVLGAGYAMGSPAARRCHNRS